ncbi:hydrogenase [Laceyella putida]|uniref:Hydrogenase n=1 Tax=Laceyella putida TaxID=110101 RepID=A0ABW2RQ76_9BACL
MDQWIAMTLLVSALILFQIRKISHSVGILAFQSVVLSLTAAWMWMETGITHLLIAAVLTLLVKGIVIPYILLYTIKKIGIDPIVERFTSKYSSLMIALALSVVGFYVTSHLHLPGTEHGQAYLPVSVILIFLGTFIMIDHKKAMMQGVGLITIENGLFLVAESISYGMPLIVELGIFFDLLVTVIVIGILSYRIHSTFESLNTEKMQNLKG